MPAHSAVLARLFQLSDIQFVTDEEPQIVLFPNLTLEEVGSRGGSHFSLSASDTSFFLNNGLARNLVISIACGP